MDCRSKKKKNGKQSEYSSVVENLDKWSCIHAMYRYAVHRKDEFVVLTFNQKIFVYFCQVKNKSYSLL